VVEYLLEKLCGMAIEPKLVVIFQLASESAMQRFLLLLHLVSDHTCMMCWKMRAQSFQEQVGQAARTYKLGV
jgi:hypothetical protein